MIYHDEIIDEVWNNRDTYAAQHHHNLHALVADLRKRQKKPFTTVIDRRNRTKVTPLKNASHS